MSKVDTRQCPEMTEPFIRSGWTREKLDAGDYEIYDAVGEPVLIEDKPISKLIDDMQDGVLERQCRILAEATPFSILLIRERWMRDTADNILGLRHRMTWQAVWNRLESIQRLGPGRISIQLCTDINHAIERIFELETKYKKEFFSSFATQMPGDKRIAVLSNIYGISIAKSKAIIEKHPTLYSVATASVDELRCDGIGPKLARRIYEFWRQGNAEYGSGITKTDTDNQPG